MNLENVEKLVGDKFWVHIGLKTHLIHLVVDDPDIVDEEVVLVEEQVAFFIISVHIWSCWSFLITL